MLLVRWGPGTRGRLRTPKRVLARHDVAVGAAENEDRRDWLGGGRELRFDELMRSSRLTNSAEAVPD